MASFENVLPNIDTVSVNVLIILANGSTLHFHVLFCAFCTNLFWKELTERRIYI